MESPVSITLIQAVGMYVDSCKGKSTADNVHRELFRFVQWCGPERPFGEINQSEIGEYADNVGGTGTTPLAAERLQAVRGFLSYARKQGLIEKNLAQHVRIRKSKNRVSANSKKIDQKIIELTPEGHAQLVQQLDKLRSERGPLAEQIKRAAADKDVRENAPLEAAREQLGHVEARIRELETHLKDSVVIDPARGRVSSTVKLGMKVVVKEMNSGKETGYVLVSQTEAKPLEQRISDVSPLGKALVGASVGQEVRVDTPRGTIMYRITKVSA